MANINGHEIFFGIVGQVDAPTIEDKLPSWFPDVNPVNDLSTHFGSDMSDYYVDVCLYYPSAGYRYTYTRCYCDTDESVYVKTTNGTQLFLDMTGANKKVAFRKVIYTSEGAVYLYEDQAWSSMSINIGGDNFDTSKVCIVDKGKAFKLYGNFIYLVI